MPANDNGVVDGKGSVQTIYGATPRKDFPETLTRCLTGIVASNQQVLVTDNCTGMLIELKTE